MFFNSSPRSLKSKIKEGFIPIMVAIVILAVAVFSVSGYFGLKQMWQSKAEPSGVNDQAVSEEVDFSVVDDYLNEIARKPFPAKNTFADQVIAQIKIISKKSEAGAWPAKFEIVVERIKDYYRYPEASYPQLKTGKRLEAYFTAFYDYNSPSPSMDNIVVGESYPAYLTICHSTQVVCAKDETFKSWMVNLFPTEKIVRVAGLKITSPTNDSSVKIGQPIVLKVEVNDSLKRGVFYSTAWGQNGYIKAPDYEIQLIVPSKYDFGGKNIDLSPGQKRIGVVGGDKASSDEVFINVVE